MFRRCSLAFALSVAAPLLLSASCGGDAVVPADPVDTADAGGGAPDGGGAAADAAADANDETPSWPLAKGDPCRGKPLPEDEHFVAPGLCARLVSVARSGLRQITFAPNGDMLGVSNDGAIYLFRDADEDGFFSDAEIHVWGQTGGTGNNAHVDVAGGYLYAGASAGVKRFAYDPQKLEGGEPEDVVVGQPSGGHSKKTVHVFDGSLYVHSGSSGNVTHESAQGSGAYAAYDTKRSLIKRFDLSKLTPGTPFAWDAGEPFTLGLRNANGFARNETTKKVYAVVNGSDNLSYKGEDVHVDNPGEQVVELAAGKGYGYPFCFTAQRIVDGGAVIAPGTQLANPGFPGNPHDDAWCAANSSLPTTFVQAHSAPLDITFFDRQPQGVLPDRWRGGAFIALHGSWNRSPSTGYSVVWQPFNADGTAPMPTSTSDATSFPHEVVFGGGSAAASKDGAWTWSSGDDGEGVRPAGVAISPVDGALYVSSDASGYVYRVGIRKP